MHEDQPWLKKEDKILRAGESMRENTRDGEVKTQVDERKIKCEVRRKGRIVEKKRRVREKRYLSCLATRCEMKSVIFKRKPIIFLIYKEALINTHDLDSSLSSVVVSLLHEYGDLFLKRFQEYYHLLGKSSIKLNLCLEHLF